MSGPSHAEILSAAWARVSANSAFMAKFGGRVYNHLPQDTEFPCARIRWQSANEWDTKTSQGEEGELIVDMWTDQRGDKFVLESTDMIIAIFHNLPLTLSSSDNFLMRRERMAQFVEPDGITHHCVVTFRAIASPR